ncbi:MAG: hypothetical protein GX660_02270, partial [Clostridiaceae bacterium]|nr:hypothetical protein [Clostridiaceae bacterium]
GSSKELVINAPVNTAGKKVEMRITNGKSVVKSFDYNFKKIISPESPVIGVLSEDKLGLRILNGLKLTENFDSMHPEEARKIKMMIAAGKQYDMAERPVEVISLGKDNFPVDLRNLSTFDYIIISDYDTSVLSDKQKEALEQWVEGGKVLILGTGANGRKVYKGLGDKLKPLAIEDERSIPVPPELEAYVEKKAPSGEITISTGNIGDGEVIIGNETNPLAVLYKRGAGKILYLSFDPTMSPIAGWDNAEEMWKKLLSQDSAVIDPNSVYYPGKGYYAMPQYYGNEVVNQVHETQTPPVNTLMVVIAFYILIAGPVLYIFLKIKDKRDWNWLIIPALAFVFMGVIYFAGFKTRYDTAVFNKFSIINLEQSSKNARIQTSIGAFNNRREVMKLEYPEDHDITVSPNMNNYYYRGEQDYEKVPVVSKVLLSNPLIHEQYKVAMWEPVYISMEKDEKFDGDFFTSIDIRENKLTAVIKNSTGFTFEDSFMRLGNNFIDIGNILPGEEKKLEVMIDDSTKVKNSYDAFMQARYPEIYNPMGPNRSKAWIEQNRKMMIFNQLNMYDQFYLNQLIAGSPKIYFYALNFDSIEDDIKVNDRKPKTYNTNLIVCSQDLIFEKGKTVEIPAGIISSVVENAQVEFEGPNADAVRIYESGDISFKFTLPENIQVNSFEVDWPLDKPFYGEVSTGEKKFYIYNNQSGAWEEFTGEFKPSGKSDSYVNSKNEIILKATVTLDMMTKPVDFVTKPQIQFSGVVK